MQNEHKKDYLWLNLRDLPYFRALLRGVESRFYQDFMLEAPILDLGCGDGHFASIAFDQQLDVGLDPWHKQLGSAVNSGAYKMILQGLGAQMPFPDASFSSIISNSVLEHIQDIDAVITEVARVIKPGGLFLFCVPNHNFTRNLSVAKNLEQIGLTAFAELYRNWFNKISRHQHCDPPQIWEKRLERNRITVERYWHYFSPEALSILEWGHYFGLPSLVMQKLTGRWILVKRRWNLRLIEKTLRPYFAEHDEQNNGSYTFFVTRKE